MEMSRSGVLKFVREHLSWQNVGFMLLKQIVGFLTFFLIVRTFHWVIQATRETRPQVRLASLTAFDLAGANSALAYALWIDLQFHQHVRGSSKIPVDYVIRNDHLRSAVFYAGAKVGPTDDTLPPFKQHLTTTTVVHQHVEGEAGGVGAAVVEAFQREKAQGFFNLQLKVRFSKKLYKIGHVYVYRYTCPLRFAVPTNDTIAVVTDVKCRRKWSW